MKVIFKELFLSLLIDLEFKKNSTKKVAKMKLSRLKESDASETVTLKIASIIMKNY